MPTAKENTRVNIVISKKNKKILDEIAEKEKRKPSNLAAKIILDYIEDYENRKK